MMLNGPTLLGVYCVTVTLQLRHRNYLRCGKRLTSGQSTLSDCVVSFSYILNAGALAGAYPEGGNQTVSRYPVC
jgi:hypothetical protein